jgi:hypothetical protein
VTPTRDRPECFALAERWMARQYEKDFAWIVVDDGDEPARLTMGQTHVRRNPSGARCTLPENVLAGLAEANKIHARFILFVEDDDWYSARYVRYMLQHLRRAGVVGEMRRKYYHVPTRGIHSSYNRKHAALASTGVRGDAFHLIKRACERAIKAKSPYVDMFLWGVYDPIEPRWKRVQDMEKGKGKKMFSCRTLSVGLKGMPGRGGLGTGHDDAPYKEFDRDTYTLRKWVGDEEAEAILALVPVPYVPAHRLICAPT